MNDREISTYWRSVLDVKEILKELIITATRKRIVATTIVLQQVRRFKNKEILILIERRRKEQ